MVKSPLTVNRTGLSYINLEIWQNVFWVLTRGWIPRGPSPVYIFGQREGGHWGRWWKFLTIPWLERGLGGLGTWQGLFDYVYGEICGENIGEWRCLKSPWFGHLVTNFQNTILWLRRIEPYSEWKVSEKTFKSLRISRVNAISIWYKKESDIFFLSLFFDYFITY